MGWNRSFKTFFAVVLMLCFVPVNGYAQEESLIPMGHSIGIQMDLSGIYVTSDVSVDQQHLLKKGDIIQRLNGAETKQLVHFERAIQKQMPATMTLDILRNGEKKTLQADSSLIKRVTPFLKDRTEGTGTLTYVDPKTGTYGALGHQIIDSTLQTAPSFEKGAIYLSEISQIKKSSPGFPGYKISSIIDQNNLLGTIRINNVYGIFGSWKNAYHKVLAEPLEIMHPVELKIGPAEIFTTVQGSSVEKFSIRITKIEEEQFHILLTDPILLKKTGGILQGMSGSPVIQNGKFVGAITHMFVDEPEKGAALFLKTMRTHER
ncbi:peptidase [Sporosarcina sp. PTS2304]|uniref:SpoIVB peptidase S55 domain-containing protein n=1 Tax=Sporosarcina sp. PTS2304 TaxID=2283194 RepID=UPI000E0CFEF0|nr:SpoIVB peptidase S55 domain-containing protein [Sporosarcina sp. PTS2304]AXH99074.1 peptidase [Sporosarcina sp. PTS2304]